MRVEHSKGSYEVVHTDIAPTLSEIQNAFVITDENVSPHWGHVAAGKPTYIVPAGETSKSIQVYEQCLHWLSDQKASRASTVIALGGGVVGDLAGFVAATYMRGIRLVQIPTSLLAMVDSSVGGKVGIDLPQGKNLVGSFYPPERVVIDFKTLKTLPAREFNNGAAEIYKNGAALDWALFAELEAKPLRADDERLPRIVMHCVDLKRQIVEADEHETSGQRAVLNFGHTVGHAIERVTGYGPVLHGEAIAAGMVIEARIGARMGMTPPDMADKLGSALARQGLPSLPSYEPKMLIEFMRLDKKASEGRLAFALLTGYGSCKLVPDVPEKVVLECLQENI